MFTVSISLVWLLFYDFLLEIIYLIIILVYVTFNIYIFFSVPPDHVRIRKEPDELRVGVTASLTCDASSSNPPAQLSWWREGIPVSVSYTHLDVYKRQPQYRNCNLIKLVIKIIIEHYHYKNFKDILHYHKEEKHETWNSLKLNH